ncbi:MAG: CarD family transcriptional regulator, partial [Thermodesulfobacteriota bacterium]
MDIKKEKPSLFETLYTLNDLKSGEAISLSGLKGSSWAYLFAHLFREAGESVMVLAPDPEMAEEAFTDLSFFIEPTLSQHSTFKDRKVFLYPFWETLPYEDIEPYPEIVNKRIEALFRLLHGPPIVLVTTPRAIMQKVIPKEELLSSVRDLKVGDEIDRDLFIEGLIQKGFQNVGMVEGRGEIGVRGGIIDIFSPGYSLPLRLEFMGDSIESIRLFDPATQRSEKRVEGVTIFPVRESLPGSCLSPFLDYLSSDSFLCIRDQTSLEDEASRFEGEIDEGFNAAVETGKRPLKPDRLYLSKKEFLDTLSPLRRIFLDTFLPPSPEEVGPVSSIDISSADNIDLRQRVNLKKEGNLLEPLAKKIKGWQAEGWFIYLVTVTHGHAERLKELLSGYDIGMSIGDRSQIISLPFDDLGSGLERSSAVNIIEGRLNTGFRIPSIGLMIITEEELFGKRVKRRSVPTRRVDELIDRMKELKVSDLVVHALHGIGIYRGLKKLKIGSDEGDYLLITYQSDERLYVPVYRLNLVQKYIGGEEGSKAPIDRLGGKSWEKAKKKVKEDAEKVAKELLEIYAAREALKGFAFSGRDRSFHEFEESFEYEETPDQAKAIKDTLSDMESSKPMDRLICGDVGYGKTEVALRASFKAVIDGKQVAFLAPTTILAQQHYQTFRERLAPYPVNVEML